MARPGPKSKYNPEKIYTAVETVALVGVREASRLNRVPITTVFDWKELDKQGMLEEFVEEKSLTEKGDNLPDIRQQNRAVFISKAAALVNKMLEKMEDKIEDASFKDLTVGIGILYDKIALASGDPTSRTESVRETVSRETLLAVAMQVSDKVKSLPRRHSQRAE